MRFGIFAGEIEDWTARVACCWQGAMPQKREDRGRCSGAGRSALCRQQNSRHARQGTFSGQIVAESGVAEGQEAK